MGDLMSAIGPKQTLRRRSGNSKLAARVETKVS